MCSLIFSVFVATFLASWFLWPILVLSFILARFRYRKQSVLEVISNTPAFFVKSPQVSQIFFSSICNIRFSASTFFRLFKEFSEKEVGLEKVSFEKRWKLQIGWKVFDIFLCQFKDNFLKLGICNDFAKCNFSFLQHCSCKNITQGSRPNDL